MFNLHNVDRIPSINSPAVAASDGFAIADLAALGEVQANAIARQLWGRGQLVANEFAHYLAVWRPQAGASDPPALALARFKKTGTYVLTIGTTVVASGKEFGGRVAGVSGRVRTATVRSNHTHCTKLRQKVAGGLRRKGAHKAAACKGLRPLRQRISSARLLPKEGPSRYSLKIG